VAASYGLYPALLCAVAAVATSWSEGRVRQLRRVLSLLAAVYFSLASLVLLYVVTMSTGPRGAGALFLLVFVGLGCLAALVCWAMFLDSAPRDE